MKEFIDIYNNYNMQVRSILFRYSPNGENIDDMVQETFIKIWKSLKNFEQRSSLKTWIYRIAVNAAIDYQRKNSKYSHYSEIDQITEPVAHEKTDQCLYQQLIEVALHKLSEEQKSVAILSLYQQLSTQEIADILEIPSGTVKSRLFNAKNQMQQELKKQGVQLEDLEGE